MASIENDSEEHWGGALCSAEAEELPADFQLRRALKPYTDFKNLKAKEFTIRICSGSAPLFGRLETAPKVSRADIRLAELEHSSLKKKICPSVRAGSRFMFKSLFIRL